MSDAGNSHSITLEKVPGLELAWSELSAAGLVSTALGGSLSIKTPCADSAGRDRDTLCLLDALAAANSPSLLRLDLLEELLAGASNMSAADLEFELDRSKLGRASQAATEAAFYHAALPFKVIGIATHPALLSLGCIAEWEAVVARVLGEHVLALPYASAGLPLAKALRGILPVLHDGDYAAVYLRYRGLLAFADNLDQVRASLLDTLLAAVHSFGGDLPAVDRPDSRDEPCLRVRLAELRKQLSRDTGQHLLVRSTLANVSDLRQGASNAAMAEQFVLPGPIGPGAVPAAAEDSRAGRSVIILDAQTGPAIGAPTPAALARSGSLLKESLNIVSRSAHYGTFAPLCEPSEAAAAPGRLPQVDAKQRMFAGEVALVTGAASGIGRACALSLLERGAAVIGLDISDAVLDVAHEPGYRGEICDLTDESAMLAALETAARTFGGLDILVLNAGVFPASCNLDSLSLDHWQSVMRVNVDVNVSLLREAFPLLKNAPRYGRVILNASRNVPAPGPGAAAYSASKAALTQLGRVAALEWAKAHIRVNMIHPHAVFDTGIWTDEVLQSRAAKYGMTVQQYKANNVLGVELTSRDVGELVAEMCGPLFSKVTGVQMPIDGGSDRVI